jgi:uncharacterized membrane protein (UPF0127 family)
MAAQVVCTDRFACESGRVAEIAQVELESGGVVCERCVMATNAVRRLRGLLGRKELPPGEGILLRPCASVHTMFMRFPIDVVFCDRDLKVLAVAAEVPRWRLRGQRGAKVAIELAAGEAASRGVEPGQVLRLVRS